MEPATAGFSTSRQGRRPSAWVRYRGFLTSKETVLALANGVLLLAGFFVSVAGSPDVGRWLYLASALVGGVPLFALAARRLIVHRDITVGVMASVAMIAAIIVGEWSAAALVMFMFAIGDWLENLTVARADNALRDLASLVPSTATVVRNGIEVQLALDQIVPGDTLLIRSGERIAADGWVLAGTASINEAAITGESMPSEKGPGGPIFAGSLVEVGAIQAMVEKLGSDTTLGQVARLVREARASQAPVERVANKYARILVPITFAIAIAVYLITGSILRSITVLVVVCPCALVLATPTALVAAIANAARKGILVKSGAAMERVGRVSTIAFDKTGTLTLGRPQLKEVVAFNGMGADRLLSLAASAERHSEHPIGRALVRAANEKGLTLGDPTAFEALPGYGIFARALGSNVLVGSQALMASRGIDWPQSDIASLTTLKDRGYTTVPIAVDNRLEGVLGFADTTRLEAVQAITELRSLGIRKTVMITGDNAAAAALVAGELGIDTVHSSVLPADKLNIVRELQASGTHVAYVGDGVNDGPALAAADVGIAMGVAGTDLAMEAADIGLMSDDVSRLPQLVDLSRATLRVIRQNVLFSMGMNVLAVVLGGMGIIGPALGAVMHEVSALPVLANSARLVSYKRREHPR